MLVQRNNDNMKLYLYHDNPHVDNKIQFAIRRFRVRLPGRIHHVTCLVGPMVRRLTTAWIHFFLLFAILLSVWQSTTMSSITQTFAHGEA